MSITVYDLGSLSSWLAAIGSVGALFYAIYLSKKSERIKLELNIVSDLARNVMDGDDPHKKELCITNLGVRTAHIRSIEMCEKKMWKYRTISKALSGKGPTHGSIVQGEMFKYDFSLNTKSVDENKRYYLCVSELSGKNFYVKLTP